MNITTLNTSINKTISQHTKLVKSFIWLFSLMPFAYLVYGLVFGTLGADPIAYATKFTGKNAIIFLCITLSITPIRRIFKLNSLIKFRRLIGVFTFFYALVHFMVWFGLDQGFYWASMLKDIYKRPFITVGFAALILLLLLAATSFNKAIKLLGKNWQKLHYSIYAIAILVMLHYYWIKSAKHNFAEFSIYAVILSSLLIYRLYIYIQRNKK